MNRWSNGPSIPRGLPSGAVLLAVQFMIACGTITEPVDLEASEAETATSTAVTVVADVATPSPAARPSPTSTPAATATPSSMLTRTPMPQPATATPTEPPPTPTEHAVEPTWVVDELERSLDEILEDTGGVVAVAIAAPDGTTLYERNADETLEAASLYKLGIMVEVFRQREAGLLTFDDLIVLAEAYYPEGPDSFQRDDVGAAVSIDTLLFAMIAQSSNVASYALLDLLGNDTVNATMEDLGLSGIQIRWRPENDSPVMYLPSAPRDAFETDEPTVEPDPPADAPGPVAGSDISPARWLAAGQPDVQATMRGESARNIVNAGDVARFFVLLLNGLVVSESSSAEMLDLLGRQQIYGGLRAVLPDGAVAHKTGYLLDGVVNDAGVVYTPGGPFVVVVLTEDVGDGIAHEITGKISLLVYAYGS